MADELTSRNPKLRKLGESLWQLGLFSPVITAPIGGSVGYSTGGMGGMFMGLALAFAMSAVIWLAGYLIVRALSGGNRHA